MSKGKEGEQVNTNRIVTMIMRLFMRQMTRRGMGRIARGSGTQSQRGNPVGAQRQAQALGRETTKRARQLSRITRRLGR